jgi:hypothetical protein
MQARNLHWDKQGMGRQNLQLWKLPPKNLLMIGILANALLLGLAAPLIMDRLSTIHYFDINAAVGFLSNLLPIGIFFYGLTSCTDAVHPQSGIGLLATADPSFLGHSDIRASVGGPKSPSRSGVGSDGLYGKGHRKLSSLSQL